MSWIDGVMEVTSRSLDGPWERVEDGRAWVHGVMKSWTQLNDLMATTAKLSFVPSLA